MPVRRSYHGFIRRSCESVKDGADLRSAVGVRSSRPASAGGESTNLTSTRDRETVYRRHFVESLALFRVLLDRDLVAAPVIDVGSGAGFPGLPIKIARPDVDLTLVEEPT